MQFNLVTTGPEQIENKKKGKNFFLGNWCIKLDEKKLFQSNHQYILDYHWNDKKKFNKDYSKIILQTENLLNDLSKTLNILQKKKNKQNTVENNTLSVVNTICNHPL